VNHAYQPISSSIATGFNEQTLFGFTLIHAHLKILFQKLFFSSDFLNSGQLLLLFFKLGLAYLNSFLIAVFLVLGLDKQASVVPGM
jgi:hypothetical protein